MSSCNLDSTSGDQLLRFLRHSVDALDQSVVMVTHSRGAAAYADRVAFFADGQIVSELREPTPELVIDHMRDLEAPSGIGT